MSLPRIEVGLAVSATSGSSHRRLDRPRRRGHGRMPRLPRPGALLPCLLAGTLLLPASPAVGRAARGLAARIATLVRFDFAAHETPENLAIGSDGSIYASLAYASQVRRIAPDGTQARVALPTGGGIVVGVAVDRRAQALDVAVRSARPEAAGIWQIALAGFGGARVPRRLAALPVASFPNGISFDARGALYVADSSLGRIWRVLPGARRATVWSADPLLRANGTAFRGFPFPGANGVHPWHGALYVSNTARGTIVRIPLRPDGSAGRAAVRFAGVQAVDDFTFDARGTVYVAANAANELLRLAPDGGRAVVATRARDGLDNPSAVAFGVGAHRTDLYIANAAYFSPAPRPSVQRLHVGTPGAPTY